ncbi:MAG: tetratricopeptide repeat protein [Sandaracinaceae bacterium]|nr:tetratricopeptide repeat protein [Sandaracinaceae bacterium]
MKPLPIAAVAWLLASVAAAQAAPCASVDACAQALSRGQHEVALAGLTALAARPATRDAASLGLARVYLETGRYGDAAALARAGQARQRVEASTLLGEAEMAQGHLDDAERALSSVGNEPSAHRARLLLGRLLIRRGRAADARRPLMALIQAYNDESIRPQDAEGLGYVAVAAHLLNSPHDANDAFQESTRADPRRVETQLDWAELFMSHWDPGHAEESVRAALDVNPNSPRARALLARLMLDQSLDFTHAEEELARALAVNPNLVMAHVTRAGIAIRDMDLSAADQHLERALAVDPNDLEALSVRAVIPFLRGDTRAYQAATRAVLERNARYATMYVAIAEYGDWEHRYPELVELAREGIRVDPGDPRVRAILGINLLRVGREEEGLAALREAWDRDHFNVRVYNLLELWDNTITPSYEEVAAGPLVFRLHREERAVMGPTVTETLTGAWNDMRRRYGFTPQTPVHIEMYSDPEHFSVRTSGLPNIGVQGVCFGQVITALSPRAGPFNWGQITWHELAHVFHLQLSHNRVPRWFTEGLAEYETMIARPEWQREEDFRLYRALAADRLPPVAQLNHAFTHARSADAITVAYYASSMLVKYIVDTYGFDRVPRMLRAWGEDRSSEDVVQRVLGISIEQLDRDFRAHTAQRLAGRADDFAVDFAAYEDLDAIRAVAEQAPTDADAQAALAAALTAHGADPNEAMTAVRAALRLDADHPVARLVAARLAVGRRDTRTAAADLRLFFASGHDGYEPRLLAARVAIARERIGDARAALEAATRIDPGRVEAWQGLGEIAERTHDEALQLDVLRHLVDVDQHDRAANFQLMEHLAAAGDWAGLREYGARGVLVDPLHAEARRLYAEALLHDPLDARAALAQADLALAAEPEAPAQAHLTRARALMALRRRRDAQAAVDAAIAADASVAEAARALLR